MRGMSTVVGLDGTGTSGVPSGGVPVAVAVFVSVPASTSAWVTVYVAVQVSNWPANSVVDGQSITESAPVPEKSVSATPTPVSVTFPVLVTKNEYVTVSPAFVTWAGLADLAIVIPGWGGVGTVTVEGPDGTGVVPPTGVPSAVAVLLTEPEFTSAAVSV